MHSLLNIYTASIDNYTAIHAALRKKAAMLSILRLIAFATILLTVYLAFTNANRTSLLVCAFFGIAVFIVLVRRSVANTERRRLVSTLLDLIKNELAITEGRTNFFDDGESVSERRMHA